MENVPEEKMKRGLKNRHMQMIALGGAIGTGLFYGSASTIQLAGPAIALSYFIGGTIIFFIMRMLGEMAVDNPVSGSFSFYAKSYWHEFIGFLSGWNYWFNYVVVSMAELTAVGIYMNYWYPDIPQWVSALACLIIITLINLINVRMYGEFEFFTAIIKVVAIIGMIIFGTYLIFTQMGAFPDCFANLWQHGGFMPNGIWGLALSLVIVMFSFGGIELIGITAGEADNPNKTIPKAINQVIWRVLIFYIGTLVVLMTLYPWNEVGLEASPFVQIFSNIGIPAAANLLNIVVLTAALSVYNSAIYSNSRMLYGLAKQGDAPKIFTRLAKNGVPYIGIFVSSGITLIVVALNYFIPGKVFMYLISIAVAAVVVSWVIITITHLKFRKLKIRENQVEQLHFKSIGYPYINYLCLAFLIMIVLLMTQIEDMQLAVGILPIWIGCLWIGYKIRKNK
ncbi:amino acid permease [Anaerosinus gibii]|uniref:Amino acid permease n=1 Tax=Selenobaculum gibii TaxID=3054208 RepID=A0A9Y2AK13_9FIRM|nr:amino acid permease [Selenobaculum gbiensis]WIW71639.1 amino acid permease [Selenobaculum gbiensis]